MRWLLVLLLVGCGEGSTMDGGAEAAVPDGRRCLDDARYETCAMGSCVTARCRGDELCSEEGCAPFSSVELSCDFVLDYDPRVERRLLVQVAPGGFPRAQVEALRFDFGDGVAGWAETLNHDYEAPGVYPVTLDVRFEDARTCRSRQLAFIDPPADHDPLRLTVDEIPRLLNGSVPLDRGLGPEPFVLSVPREGFTVDVSVLASPDDPVTDLSLTVAPLGDVTDRVRFEHGAVRIGQWRVDEPLPLGPATFRLAGRTGSAAFSSELTVQVVELTPERDPFDRPMVWLFLSDVDLFTTTRQADGALLSEPFPNGRADLIEELALIGAQGADAEMNQIYLDWIRELVRREVYRTYGIAPDGTALDDIPLRVVWQDEPGAPDRADFAADGDVSLMRFGGTFDGFVGFSGISPWNESRTDDSGIERGVASAGLIGILSSTPIVSTVFAPITPGTGTPVGEDPLDAAALDPGFDRWALDAAPALLERHETLRSIARYIALVLASVTAHEMGHAMGLMPNGVPPNGFFGDVSDVPFVNPERTNPWHADLPGLNLMQAGGDYLGVLDEALTVLELPRGADLVRLAEVLALENRLSPYARAYLQGRLTYDSADGMASGLSVGCRHDLH